MKQFFVVALFSLCALAACKTQFYGEPHYPGGAQACQANCEGQNMEMSGFVYSGEFASSCVCRPRGGAPGMASQDQAAEDVGDASALVGVAVQTDDDDNARASNR